MTDPYANLKVETKVLVENGTNRMEDALACDAARLVLAAAGAVPAWAFGSIPGFSDELRAEWNDQFAARCEELASIRDALWNAGAGLIRVAADYENTDVEVAFFIGESWSVDDNKVGSYLNTLMGAYSPTALAAGQSIPTSYIEAQAAIGTGLSGEGLDFPTFYQRENMPTYSQEITTETIHLDPMGPNTDFPWPWEEAYWKGFFTTEVEVPKVSITADPGVESASTDALAQFVQRTDQGWALSLAEAILDFEQLATGGRPMQDMIIPAWAASPTVFENRKDALSAVSGTIAEIADRVVNQSGRLNSYWEGVGASAYLSKDQSGLAPLMGGYLAGLSARVDWFVIRCYKLCDAIRTIRNVYALRAVKEVEAVNAANDEYRKAAIALLSDPGSAVSLALNAVYSVYATQRDADAKSFENDLDSEKTTIATKASVSLGELYTEPRRFQPPGGGEGWTDPSLWKKKGDSPSSYTPEQELGR